MRLYRHCFKSKYHCFKGVDMEILDKILGSKGRTAIFRELFDGHGRSMHISELAKRNHLSTPSLMREAKALVKLGLLQEIADGNRINYSASTDSPLFAPISELVKQCCGGKALLESAFSDSDNPAVFIYGSRARGNARANSDYDVFVIGNEGLRKTTARLRPIIDKLGVEVNPYVLTPEEFKRRFDAGDHFLNEVIASPKIYLKGGDNVISGMA